MSCFVTLPSGPSNRKRNSIALDLDIGKENHEPVIKKRAAHPNNNPCFIPSCSHSRNADHSKLANISFYRISANRQHWLQAINVRSADGSLIQPTKSQLVCSTHFVSGNITFLSL